MPMSNIRSLRAISHSRLAFMTHPEQFTWSKTWRLYAVMAPRKTQASSVRAGQELRDSGG